MLFYVSLLVYFDMYIDFYVVTYINSEPGISLTNTNRLQLFIIF
jgi:hypothetical protein